MFSTKNSLFEVWEVLAFGVGGAILAALEFPAAPILLGFVLGPLVEENFRRTLLLSHGDLTVFLQRPISATFVTASFILVAAQLFFALKSGKGKVGLRPNPPGAEPLDLKI